MWRSRFAPIALVLAGLWGYGAALPTLTGGKNLTVSSVALANEDCYYDYRRRRCEPADQCVYRYRFLDATLGESCRLKEEKKLVRPVYKSKLMAHPGVIAAGATGLFLGDIALIIFTPLLQNFPLTFNLIQGFVLCLAGDTYFQIIEQGVRAKMVGVKIWRAVRSGLIGALNNGFIHYLYYKWIDRRFPYHLFTEDKFGKPEGAYYKLSVAWAKYWIEWPTIGVYKIASMMALTSLLGGKPEQLADKFKKKFLLTWLRSLQVWPIYDTVLYAYVPASHRPLFNTFMSIVWGGYLSSLSQDKDSLTDGVEGAAASATKAAPKKADKPKEKKAEKTGPSLTDQLKQAVEDAPKKVDEAVGKLEKVADDLLAKAEGGAKKVEKAADDLLAKAEGGVKKVEDALQGLGDKVDALIDSLGDGSEAPALSEDDMADLLAEVQGKAVPTEL